MQQIYKDRWEKLLTFLDKLPPERFHYGVFVGRNWGGAKDLSCGTVACAAGWATAIFDELSFDHFRNITYTDSTQAALFAVNYLVTPTDRTLAHFFGVSLYEVHNLFYPKSMARGFLVNYWRERSPRSGIEPRELVDYMRRYFAARDTYEAMHGDILVHEHNECFTYH